LRNLGPVVPWLSLDNIAGSIPGGMTDSLRLTVNTEGMPDGKYQAWVILQDNFENEIIIPVNLVVDTFLGEQEITGITGKLSLMLFRILLRNRQL
jgi:hypothetical protein